MTMVMNMMTTFTPLRRSLQLLRLSTTTTTWKGAEIRITSATQTGPMSIIPTTLNSTTTGRRHFITSHGSSSRLTTTTTSTTSAILSRQSVPQSRNLHTSESSINNDIMDESESDSAAGQEAYQQYLDVKTKLIQVQAEKERVKSEQMYQAWQRANEKQLEHEEDATKTKKANKKAPGVEVVKTLVKQTHKDKETAQAEATKWQEQAQGMLEKAALEFGYPLALVQLGNQALEQAQREFGTITHTMNGNANTTTAVAAAKESMDRAMDLYRKAGTGGASEGWFNLGNLLWTGYPDQTEHEQKMIVLPMDEKASMEAFRHAVELGDADAMYFAGVSLFSSKEDDDDDGSDPTDDQLENMRSCLALIVKASGLGHGGALYYLALFYLNGHDGLDIPACSPQDFVKRLDAAVEAGDSDALFLRGHCSYQGDNGYPLDYAKALGDFLQASDAGNADAAVSAGAILHQGRPGVRQNLQKAFELYQHGGELGNIEGWRNVVACYLTGEGVPRSKEIAKYIAETMLKEK